MSTRSDILTAFVSRLTTLTVANGYSFDLMTVHSDDIPMGSQIPDHELPSILVLDTVDEVKTEMGKLAGTWNVELQLWHRQNPDSVMQNFVREVFKVVYANSPTEQTTGGFRGIHPAIVELIPTGIAGDMNMIEGNRVYRISLAIRYRANLWDL